MPAFPTRDFARLLTRMLHALPVQVIQYVVWTDNTDMPKGHGTHVSGGGSFDY
jgi:hypothetical protein